MTSVVPANKFDVRTVLIAGVGFLIDAYDIFVIGMVIAMVYEVYYPGINGHPSTFYKENPFIDGLMKTGTHVGNIIGQLGFGYLADKVGRKQVYGVEMIIVLVATIGSAVSSSAVRGFSVLALLGTWRFILGIGMGGDYPQSATITAERAGKDRRGMMVAAVFSMQGVGILLGSVIVLVTVCIFRDLIVLDPLNLDYVWRIALGVPAIPCVILLYYRFTLVESEKFIEDQKLNLEAALKPAVINLAAENRLNSRDFTIWIRHPTNAKRLFATAYTWFALDVAWYGLTLNQSAILGFLGFAGNTTVFAKYYNLAVGNLIIAMMGTVPGYFVTVALIEKLGRKPIQYLGFAALTLILGTLSIFYQSIKTNAPVFIALFTIAQFFFNFGPNVTTFVIPSELFPTRFRSTCHGISAACGKVGAIVGVAVIGPYFTSSPQAVLATYALVMVTGFAATALLPETKGLELEELSE